MVRLLVCFAAFCAVLNAQGTRPKENPTEYPAHADVNGVTIAAENVGHSITSEYGAYFARDYLVVDVAIFSKNKRPLRFSPANFSLRLNGKKTPLLAQTPGIVAASIKYDDWSEHPRMMGSGGAGDTGVTLGGPKPQGRFPGDPNGNPRVPQPPSVDTNNPNVPQNENLPIEETVAKSFAA
jgi:hypothetical protein